MCGQSLYGPTDLFIEYALKNEIIKERILDFDLSKYCYEYVVKWMKTYEDEKNMEKYLVKI